MKQERAKKLPKIKSIASIVFDVFMVLLLLYDILFNFHFYDLIILIAYIFLAVKTRKIKKKNIENKEEYERIKEENENQINGLLSGPIETKIGTKTDFKNGHEVKSFTFSKK